MTAAFITTSTSLLLNKLPAKLRNRIYTLVLESDAPIEVKGETIESHTAILKTNIRILKEASGLLQSRKIRRQDMIDIAWAGPAGSIFVGQEALRHFPCGNSSQCIIAFRRVFACHSDNKALTDNIQREACHVLSYVKHSLLPLPVRRQ